MEQITAIRAASHTVAYREGAYAYEKGIPSKENPYRAVETCGRQKRERRSWALGWITAKKKKQAEAPSVKKKRVKIVV